MMPRGTAIHCGTPQRLLMAVLTLCAPAIAAADGGRVELSQVVGTTRVTVFSSPTPIIVGPIDISILSQDDPHGTILHDRTIDVICNHEASGMQITQRATQDQATNRLLQSAKFHLPQPGIWSVTIRLDDSPTDQVTFALHAGQPPTNGKWLILIASSPLVYLLMHLLRERVRTQKDGP